MTFFKTIKWSYFCPYFCTDGCVRACVRPCVRLTAHSSVHSSVYSRVRSHTRTFTRSLARAFPSRATCPGFLGHAMTLRSNILPPKKSHPPVPSRAFDPRILFDGGARTVSTSALTWESQADGVNASGGLSLNRFPLKRLVLFWVVALNMPTKRIEQIHYMAMCQNRMPQMVRVPSQYEQSAKGSIPQQYPCADVAFAGQPSHGFIHGCVAKSLSKTTHGFRWFSC